jgi:hypothetical protein
MHEGLSLTGLMWLCLVTCPRETLMPDSRWRGVSPAHEHNWAADVNRVTSPISATITSLQVGVRAPG